MSVKNGLARIGTAIIGIPLVVWTAYLGGWPFLAIVVVAALVAQHELYGLLSRTGARPLVLPGLAVGLLVGLRAELPAMTAIALLLALGITVTVLLSSRFEDPWQTVSSTLTGIFYPTFLLTFLVDLRTGAATVLGSTEAFWLTMTVFALVWVSDTAAYYVGKAVGRRPLAPAISPKKTWEGSIGGGVGSIVVALILWNLDLVSLGWFDFVALGLICGSLAQLGDLAESRLKRFVGVKDSGTILPGHGGLLDRFDAMIVAVPLAYFYLVLVAGVV